MSQEITIPLFHFVANAALRLAYRIVLDLDVQGRENVLYTGPLIIVINHTHFIDPLIPGALLRPDIFPMAKAEVFEGKWHWMFKAYGSFPVRRGEADMQALKHAFKILRAGHVVLMAPEGTRARSGGLQEAHEGVALIASRANVPVLPIAEWGGRGTFETNVKRFRKTKIHVRIGAPVWLKTVGRKLTRDDYGNMTDEIMYTLAAMLPPEFRGRYSDVEKFAPRYLVPYDAGAMPSQTGKAEVMSLTR